jgi:hypothetical protein
VSAGWPRATPPRHPRPSKDQHSGLITDACFASSDEAAIDAVAETREVLGKECAATSR